MSDGCSGIVCGHRELFLMQFRYGRVLDSCCVVEIRADICKEAVDVVVLCKSI